MAKKQRDALEAKLLRASYWRTYGAQCSTNVAKQNSHAFLVSLIPWLDHLYGDNKEELAAAMVRHNVFYNTNYTTSPFIVGLAIVMEKERAATLGTEEELDASLVTNMKVALQGPLAGLGDAILFNTVRVIAAGVAMPLAAQGSPLGVFLFCLINGGVQVVMRYNLFYLGYDVGTPFIERIVDSGVVEYVTNAASILGLMMIGAMICGNVNINIGFVLKLGDVTLGVQEILNSIMPNIPQLGMLFLTVTLLRKRWSPTKIIMTYLAGCILLGIVGVF